MPLRRFTMPCPALLCPAIALPCYAFAQPCLALPLRFTVLLRYSIALRCCALLRLCYEVPRHAKPSQICVKHCYSVAILSAD